MMNILKKYKRSDVWFWAYDVYNQINLSLVWGTKKRRKEKHCLSAFTNPTVILQTVVGSPIGELIPSYLCSVATYWFTLFHSVTATMNLLSNCNSLVITMLKQCNKILPIELTFLDLFMIIMWKFPYVLRRKIIKKLSV